jgi:hypothetical protein
MLFGETVAVYCENHTEHTDTVRISQETHYVSTTQPNRLMLFAETFAVYFENTQVHSVGRTLSFGMLNRVVHTVIMGLEKIKGGT